MQIFLKEWSVSSLRRRNIIELCVACFGEKLVRKIRSLAQLLIELLQIQLFKTCIMKSYTY